MEAAEVMRLRRIGDQRRRSLTVERSGNRLAQEFKSRTALLDTRGERGPDSFAPLTSVFAARPLCDFSIDHDKPKALLHGVVRRFNPVGM